MKVHDFEIVRGDTGAFRIKIDTAFPLPSDGLGFLAGGKTSTGIIDFDTSYSDGELLVSIHRDDTVSLVDSEIQYQVKVFYGDVMQTLAQGKVTITDNILDVESIPSGSELVPVHIGSVSLDQNLIFFAKDGHDEYLIQEVANVKTSVATLVQKVALLELPSTDTSLADKLAELTADLQAANDELDALAQSTALTDASLLNEINTAKASITEQREALNQLTLTQTQHQQTTNQT